MTSFRLQYLYPSTTTVLLVTELFCWWQFICNTFREKNVIDHENCLSQYQNGSIPYFDYFLRICSIFIITEHNVYPTLHVAFHQLSSIL